MATQTETKLKLEAPEALQTVEPAASAGWILSRPDVAEPELRAAHPGVDAPGLLARLREAGLLAAAAAA